jgi:hypothetical protein
MTFGNNGAASGVQPTAGQPTLVQPFAPGVIGQPPGQAGATLPPCYNSGFESLLAAASRGEVSLNQTAAVSGIGGLGNANGNPTMLQAMSQGIPQNGTNGLGVRAGPMVGEGNGGLGSAVMAASGVSSTAFGGAVMNDAKQMVSAPAVARASPIQYGGN